MVSWLAGSVALPRPVTLGTLGVRVMVERMVGRVREDEMEGAGEEEVGAEGVGKEAEQDRGDAAEELEVEAGGLQLDSEVDNLAWFWIWEWVTELVWF